MQKYYLINITNYIILKDIKSYVFIIISIIFKFKTTKSDKKSIATNPCMFLTSRRNTQAIIQFRRCHVSLALARVYYVHSTFQSHHNPKNHTHVNTVYTERTETSPMAIPWVNAYAQFTEFTVRSHGTTDRNITIFEWLLRENKYKVAGFDLEYTRVCRV